MSQNQSERSRNTYFITLILLFLLIRNCYGKEIKTTKFTHTRKQKRERKKKNVLISWKNVKLEEKSYEFLQTLIRNRHSTMEKLILKDLFLTESKMEWESMNFLKKNYKKDHHLNLNSSKFLHNSNSMFQNPKRNFNFIKLCLIKHCLKLYQLPPRECHWEIKLLFISQRYFYDSLSCFKIYHSKDSNLFKLVQNVKSLEVVEKKWKTVNKKFLAWSGDDLDRTSFYVCLKLVWRLQKPTKVLLLLEFYKSFRNVAKCKNTSSLAFLDPRLIDREKMRKKTLRNVK